MSADAVQLWARYGSGRIEVEMVGTAADGARLLDSLDNWQQPDVPDVRPEMMTCGITGPDEAGVWGPTFTYQPDAVSDVNGRERLVDAAKAYLRDVAA